LRTLAQAAVFAKTNTSPSKQATKLAQLIEQTETSNLILFSRFGYQKCGQAHRVLSFCPPYTALLAEQQRRCPLKGEQSSDKKYTL